MPIVEERIIPGLARLYLVRVRDHPACFVECVDTVIPGTPRDQKWILILSTQIGCPVRCPMCDAGIRFQGNLTTSDMLGQIQCMLRPYAPADIARVQKMKIHFARMGEPSLNPAVLETLSALPHAIPNPHFVPCLSSVAPSIPLARHFFEQLLSLKHRLYSGDRFQLQFSLHTTDPEQRARFIPIPTWSFPDIAAYGKKFVRPGDRRITLNFALAHGNAFSAETLMRFFSPEHFFIKITPINTTFRSQQNHIASALPHDIQTAIADLRASGFFVLLNPSTDEELAAGVSCGQIWSSYIRHQQYATTMAH